MILFSLFNFSIVDSSFQGRETIYCFISCQNLEFVLFQVLINLISRFYRNCVESVLLNFLSLDLESGISLLLSYTHS